MTQQALEPCPWCKKPPRTCPDDSYGSATVFCPDDNECPVAPSVAADLRSGETLEDAIERWNTRLPASGGVRTAQHRINGLIEALGTAAFQFETYEKLHSAKGTPEGYDKAKRNADMAAMCRRAIRDCGSVIGTPSPSPVGDTSQPLVSGASEAVTQASPSLGDVEAVARAIEAAATVGYQIRLTRLVDGQATYTLTYGNEDPIEFPDNEEAADHAYERRLQDQARAAIAAMSASLSPDMGELRELSEKIDRAYYEWRDGGEGRRIADNNRTRFAEVVYEVWPEMRNILSTREGDQ